MAVTKKLMRMATMHAILHNITMDELAKATVREFNNAHSGDLEVDVAKESGFTLRRKKEAVITNSDIQNAIRDGLLYLAEKNEDDIKDYISDNYEFEYDESVITSSCVADMFDINRNGRLIYIEVDT